MGNISKNLKNALSEKDISIQELSELTGIDSSSVKDYCDGNTEPPIRSVKKIADALNVNYLWLMGMSEEKEKSNDNFEAFLQIYEDTMGEIKQEVSNIVK